MQLWLQRTEMRDLALSCSYELCAEMHGEQSPFLANPTEHQRLQQQRLRVCPIQMLP
jgi:hypothetical protein